MVGKEKSIVVVIFDIFLLEVLASIDWIKTEFMAVKGLFKVTKLLQILKNIT